MNEAPRAVYAVFSDGTAMETSMTAMVADENRALVLEPVGIDNPDVSGCAEKAIIAAHGSLVDQGFLKGEKKAFSFGFKGIAQVIHTSASLAFALKFAEKTMGLPFAAAATGTVIDTEGDVEKVDRINEKIEAALGQLRRGGVFFYPKSNDFQVRESLRQKAGDQNMKLVPVETVQEALAVTMELANKKRPGLGASGLTFGLAAMAAICLFAGGLYWIHLSGPPEIPRPVKTFDPHVQVVPMPGKTLDNPHPVKVSPSPVETTGRKKPLETPAPARPLEKLKVSLSGADAKTNRAVALLLRKELEKRGYLVCYEGCDGEITGTVLLGESLETPLVPFADPSRIRVERQLRLENLAVANQNGERHALGSVDAWTVYTKDRENDWQGTLEKYIDPAKFDFLDSLRKNPGTRG